MKFLWLTTTIGNPHHLFSRTGSWDIFDLNEKKDYNYAFCDPLCTKAKLIILGLLYAVEKWSGPLTIYCESDFVVDAWAALTDAQHVPLGVAYGELWTKIKDKLGGRQHLHVVNFKRAAFEVKFRNHLRNQGSDRCNNQIRQVMPVATSLVAAWRAHVDNQRAWLTKLSLLLQEQKPVHEDNTGDVDVAVDLNCDLESNIQQRYPKWDWFQPESMYDWMMPHNLEKPESWVYSDSMFAQTANFWQSLKWRCHPSAQTSVAEIAFLFWCRHRVVPPDTACADEASFATFMRWIRFWIVTFSEENLLRPVSTSYWPRKMLRLNQAFGYGLIQGARPFASRDELSKLVSFCESLPCQGSKARHWDVGLSILP
eukprot:Skav226146  [mRNA]  locus=scaffold1065:122821:123927:+ [translate_table: standard]